MNKRHSTNVAELERKINYRFQDITLLKRALTHKSVDKDNNERMEFLGDAVLNAIISKQLYQQFVGLKEGVLTRLRAQLVRGETLSQIAKDLNLGHYLSLGEGELKSGGKTRESILENGLEAVFGAVFLDSDFDTVTRIILDIYQSRLQKITVTRSLKDAKSRLQEYLQNYQYALPQYQLLNKKSLDHEVIFTVSCQLSTPSLRVIQHAKSIKKAEQACAQALLDMLPDS